MEDQQTEDSYAGGVFEGMSAGIGRDPHPMYERMRSGPVVRVPGEETGRVVVSRRADVDEVLRDPDRFSSSMHHGQLGNVRPLIPIEVDPPDQKKFRKILDPLFAPRRLAYLEEPVARLVNDLIDSFEDETEIDFSRQFSVPLPSRVFLTLLGLPVEDLPTFLRMKDGIIRPFHVLGKPLDDPEVRRYQARTASSIYDYFDDILDERERRRRDDLLSRLLAAEVDGERLTRNDVLDICFLFLIAGLDTVSASLDCFFAYLAEHPDQRAQVVGDPTCIPQVVEELLRWETPVMLVSRVAARETEVSGCPVMAGDSVYAFLGAANADESVFVDPAVVRWDRNENPHIAFGRGVHRCLGSNLARLELRVALREWHSRLPDYRIAPGAQLAFTPGVRSVDSFPMVLGSSA